MRECRTSGSVRGVPSNGHPYRNPPACSTNVIRMSSARLPRRSGFPSSSSTRCAGTNQNDPNMKVSSSTAAPFSQPAASYTDR